MRTPLAKAGKGGFKDTGIDYIIYALLKEALTKSKLDPALVEDICLGNVSAYGRWNFVGSNFFVSVSISLV